eukprot:8979747-Heterocapsa_arctica.AAC.1
MALETMLSSMAMTLPEGGAGGPLIVPGRITMGPESPLTIFFGLTFTIGVGVAALRMANLANQAASAFAAAFS